MASANDSGTLIDELDQRIAAWHAQLDAAEYVVLHLWEAAENGDLDATERLNCWTEVERAQERCRSLLRAALVSSVASQFDLASVLYATPLTRHNAVKADLREALELHVETWHEVSDQWARFAEGALAAGGPWSDVPNWVDRLLRDTERSYRSMQSAAEAVVSLHHLGGSQLLDQPHAFVDGVLATARAAKQRQDEVRRLRLGPHSAPAIGWNDEGLPIFNDPRPRTMQGTLSAGSMRPFRGTGAGLASPIINRKRRRP